MICLQQPRSYAIYCYSYSVVTIYGTCNTISHDKPFVLYTSTYRSMCAVLIVVVLFGSWIWRFRVTLLRYFLSKFEWVPVDPLIIGITLVVTFQMQCIPIVRCLHFTNFSASFLVTFLSPQTAAFIRV